jgi:FtsP/CotA-like multicopper oxidase with cupredoxin domain
MVNGYKVFNLDINESTTEFFPGIQTKTFGINSNVLGETIRIHRGDAVKLVYNNHLNEPTTMHGHGMHVPAIMDGGPINDIQPHTTWTAEYTVDQKACTNWYHPHFMHKTAEHVYMGLSGFIIIDDDESDALDLPKEYGVDDIPLALQDKRFDANGQIDYSPTTMEVRRGYLSDVMLANGVINPYVEVAAKKIRFRVLNGSNARVYKLEFSDGRSFTQIGTDNSFLEAPVELTSVVLTPAERADIIVDFKDDFNGSVILKDMNSGLEIMKINVTETSSIQQPLPTVLTTHVKYDPVNAVRTRTFSLGMSRGDDGQMHMSINGKTMDMMRMDEVVPVDEIEIWEITNTMGMEHNFHMHATHFYPLERDGSPANITASEQGYKDVIRMAPNSTVKFIVKMTDFTDDDTGYMYHCHFLEHEDDGMMGQFAVTTGEAVINVDGTSGGMGNGMGGN